jgi:NADPH2:quinone reductase
MIGTVRQASEIPAADVRPVEKWIDLESADLAATVREVTEGKSVEVVFDVVGGAIFEKCLAAVAWRGRQVSISSSPDPRVTSNLVDFYHNESRLFGLDSLKLSFDETGNSPSAHAWHRGRQVPAAASRDLPTRRRPAVV